jgi:hypothetical protein
MSRDSRLWLAEEVGAGAADHLHRVCPLVVVTVTSSRIRESTRRVSRLFLTFDLCLVSSAYILSTRGDWDVKQSAIPATCREK